MSLQAALINDKQQTDRPLGEGPGAAYAAPGASAWVKEKCRHIGMREPDAAGFLAPQQLAEARSYWERDLARQVAPGCLPDWDVVMKDLTGLLAQFFSS